MHTVLIESILPLNGFYITKYIPNTAQITEQQAQIDGLDTTEYLFEKDDPDSVYPNHTAYRWVFDTPVEFDGIRIEPLHIYKITYITDNPVSNVLFSWVGWDMENKEGYFGFN